MGLSRNKVAVPEGAAGTPPFWRRKRGYSRSSAAANAKAKVQKLEHLLSGEDDSIGCRKVLLPFPSPLGLLVLLLCRYLLSGGLAQLARAPALQAGGQRFESVILHLFVRKGIDEVNPFSDTLTIDEVNPFSDTLMMDEVNPAPTPSGAEANHVL